MNLKEEYEKSLEQILTVNFEKGKHSREIL